VRTTEQFSVGQKQLNRSIELLPLNIGKAIAYFLIRNITNSICGDLLPVFNPDPTKRAISIED
jgi:hypothetical protein